MRPVRKNTGLYLDQELIARARAAIHALGPTPHDPGTLSGIVERLLAAEVERLERDHNHSRPFPVAGPLPRGQARRVNP